MAQYSPEQLRNARIISTMTRGMPNRIRLALMEAALVESSLRHLNYGDRSSMGILQQRPDMGWGAYIPGVRGVRADIRDFLERAVPANKQTRGNAGQLAQAVQRSAFPERYQERAQEARSLLDRFRQAGRQGRPMQGGTQLPQQQPIRITQQHLNMSSPADVLAGLARVPSYLAQGGKNIAYGSAGGIERPTAPKGMTVQGVTTGDLYNQLREIRKRLLTA